MVCPVVADDVEAEPVLGDVLHLAGEEADLRRRLRLVRVVDVQEAALPHLALSPLPDVPQPALRSLVEVAGAAVARGRVALRLVQRVRGGRARARVVAEGVGAVRL